MILITSDPVDAAEALRIFMKDAGEGAAASFVGTVRGAGGVELLTLDQYPGFTQKEIAAIVATIVERHGLTAASVIHRYGPIPPGETILFAATAAPRRRAALDALDALIERLKTDAPFWKKERRDGTDRWLDAPSVERSEQADA